MRTNLRHAALAASLVLAAGLAQAAQPLLPAGGSDQSPGKLAKIAAPAGQVERAPVSFSWALDPARELSASEPFLAESREYWKTVQGTELAAGMDLPLTAQGALVRISPARGAAALKADDFSVSGANGRPVAIARAADAETLRAAGMEASAGTQVLTLGAGSSAGHHTLRAAKAKGEYVVHVFEPKSPLVLHARADRNRALAGQSMRVDISGTNAGKGRALTAEALLVAPDGSSRAVPVSVGRNGDARADIKLPVDATTAEGLWELHVFADIDGVPRDTRTAFAVAQPTAKFHGIFGHDAKRLRVSLPVDAASAGRYEARGTLYATAKDGTLHPVSEAHSAAWMEPGQGMLVLAFDPAHVPKGYGAPYEVRHLELNDQSRLAPLESRERGARF